MSSMPDSARRIYKKVMMPFWIGYEYLYLDAVLGRVKDFLGVMSEANQRLELDAKVTN